MRGHRVLEVFPVHAVERPGLHDSGVVDEDVNRAPAVNHRVDGGTHVGPAAHIAAQRQDGAAAARVELSARPPELGHVAGQEHDPRPFVDEQARQRQAQAAQPPVITTTRSSNEIPSRARESRAAIIPAPKPAARPSTSRVFISANVSLVMITFADFERVDIRVGRIVRAEPFPEARSPRTGCRSISVRR